MAKPSPSSGPDAHYSIGELSALAGISPHTVRVWERRYGRPVAVRLASGHRRYDEQQVDWLRGVAELLSFGHRPGKLMKLDDDQLTALLAEERDQSIPNHEELMEMLQAAVRDGAAGVRKPLEAALKRFGPLRAVDEVVAPLIQLVGQEWADGRLDIRHEHMISEVVQDVLRSARQERVSGNRRKGGPHLILATLPGERHGLGLEMVHLLAAVAGAEVLLLGVDLPVEEIVKSSRDHPRAAIGLSVSRHAATASTEQALGAMVEQLPKGREVVVGGQGLRVTRRRVPGVRYCGSLDEFAEWLREGFGADSLS